MSVKHKVLKDFQLLTNDKKIIVLKAKTVLEDYKYVTKNDNVLVEKEIIDNNPDFFAPIDWKEELNTYLRQNKIPQPAVITKKLVPFIEEMFVITKEPTTVYVPNNQVDVDLQSKEIELESNLKRVEIREIKLKEELEKTHIKESELLEKETNLEAEQQKLNRLVELNSQKEKELVDRERILIEQESSIKEKEDSISGKEKNLSNYVDRQSVVDFVNSKRNSWSDGICSEIIAYTLSI